MEQTNVAVVYNVSKTPKMVSPTRKLPKLMERLESYSKISNHVTIVVTTYHGLPGLGPFAIFMSRVSCVMSCGKYGFVLQMVHDMILNGIFN